MKGQRIRQGRKNVLVTRLLRGQKDLLSKGRNSRDIRRQPEPKEANPGLPNEVIPAGAGKTIHLHNEANLQAGVTLLHHAVRSLPVHPEATPQEVAAHAPEAEANH